MGMTYFKRLRMEYRLSDWDDGPSFAGDPIETMMGTVPSGYEFVPFSEGLIRQHAVAKFESFRHELDSNVFPCLGSQEGCFRLMQEICSRQSFVPEATWLCRWKDLQQGEVLAVGTIQGIEIDGWGAIQNVGIDPSHRNRKLGAMLLARAANGFREVGLKGMHLEVTTDNVGAIRFYERLGFHRAEVVYKAAEVAGA